MSRSSIEYASSTTESSLQSLEEDTTPLMEKVAFDLYAHIVNENAKEEDKKSISSEFEATTTISEVEEELTTLAEEITTIAVATTTTVPSTTTTTTTKAPSTSTTTTTTTEAPILKGGRGVLSAGRNSNRFKFQGKGQTTSTEAPSESTSAKNRFNRPSFGSSSRNSGSRFSKTTTAAVTEEVKENVEKSEAPQVSSNRYKSNSGRNRFSLRASTEKPNESNSDSESTTASRLVRPSRPQFSLRNRGRPSPASSTESSTSAATGGNTEATNAEEQEINVEKSSTEKSSIVPRPTSRLNINRPANRANVAQVNTNNKIRPSPLNRSRLSGAQNDGNNNNNGDNKSPNENESDLEATTQNNLNKLKSRPRIQINTESKAKKSTTAPVINRKANPLISKRKFGAATTGKIRKLKAFFSLKLSCQ